MQNTEWRKLNFKIFVLKIVRVFQIFLKDSLPKKITLECDFSCIIRKDDASFY